MKKIILYITILLMALTKVASSQIVTIGTVSGTFNTSTAVNVNFKNFTGGNTIGAVNMKIGYNSSVASFAGISGSQFSNIMANVVGNEIVISWFSSTPVSISDATGFVLNFNYTGGSSNLTCNQDCEIASALGSVMLTTFMNGAINQPLLSTTATVGNQPGVWTGVNELPVTFSGFPTASGALSLNFSYDNTKLQFVGLDAPALGGAIATAANGIISISWVNPTTPVNLNGINFELQFNYLWGASEVKFTGTNVISYANGSQQMPVTLIDGGITQAPSVAKVDIGDGTVTAGVATIPVVFSDFPVNPGSLSMHIAYDNSKLNFTSASGLGGLIANANNGVVDLTWYNQNNAVTNPSFNLYFNYLGGSGSNTVNFTGSNEVSSVSGGLVSVTYTDGSVTPPSTSVTVSLGNTALIPGSSNVLVPVNFAGTSGKNINAASLVITYDYTKLSYNGVYNNIPSGVVSGFDMASHTILITYNGSINDGKLLDLQFTYTGGAGNCNNLVNFTTFNSNASSLSNNLAQVVLATWVDGSVNTSPSAPTGSASQSLNSGSTVANLVATGTGIQWYAAATGGSALTASTPLVDGMHYFASQTVNGCESTTRLDVTVTLIYSYSISGILKYANTSGPVLPITNSTINLKSGLVTIATATSDAGGNFILNAVPNGTYTYEVLTAKPWGSIGVTLADYLIIKNFVNVGTPVLTGIYLLAADVNSNASVTLADYLLVKNRVNTSSSTGWVGSDWIFSAPVSVTVSGSNVISVEILGIIRGDVNATYTPPL